MTLNEEQIGLLKDFKPLDAITDEIAKSPEFCYNAIKEFYKPIPVETKIAVLKATINRPDISFLQVDMIGYAMICITREDRQKGIELVESAIRRRQAMDFGEYFICSQIGPLDENEIDAVFSAFQESERTTFLYEASYFLSKVCEKNFSPLLSRMRIWSKRTEFHGLTLHLAAEISKYLFERKAVDTEWENLTKLIKDDLSSKGIKLVKERNNFTNSAQYVEFLLAQYGNFRFDIEKIEANLQRHSAISSFLPEIGRQIDAKKLAHPLIWFLNDEKEPSESRKKMHSLVQAEYSARDASFSIIELWDFEESLNKLDSNLHGMVKTRLLNPDQYHDTLSELTVSKLLNQIGKFELKPDKDRVDGVLTDDSMVINVEVARPEMEGQLRYGHGGGMHPHGKASLIKDKLPKIRDIQGGTDTPFIIIFDGSSALLDKREIENYLFGNETWSYTLNMNTHEVVDEGFFNDEKSKGLSEEETALVSAIIVYRRKVTLTGVHYAGELIANPNAKNPISDDIQKSLKTVFNQHRLCPLISVF